MAARHRRLRPAGAGLAERLSYKPRESLVSASHTADQARRADGDSIAGWFNVVPDQVRTRRARAKGVQIEQVRQGGPDAQYPVTR
ncbi:hypothetical protein RFN58_35505 [Streptomyces iakyrus]|uniref:hypothetical protein n=1 Tax=Streptomyces iakyrus TaxID=68219 RepID=UPI000524B0AC|nr:hypothetical protein [Streptomyces iakyrus]